MPVAFARVTCQDGRLCVSLADEPLPRGRFAASLAAGASASVAVDREAERPSEAQVPGAPPCPSKAPVEVGA